MKPTKRKPFLRIMAAVDPDPFEDSRDALNALILQLAASLSQQDGAELHVAHAWTLFGESVLRGRGRFTESEIKGYLDEEMGTVCRTGIPGFFIGNTAEKILDEVDCSVLTVKPEAFQTPVKFS
jgi:hypothetical protein